MNRIPIPTIITAAALVLILVLYAVTFKVRFNETVVKVRLGKADASSVIDQPGLYFRWPWPVETTIAYDTRLQVLDAPETELKTRDGKNIIVGSYAFWRIKDPLQFFVRVKTVREAEEQMRARIGQVRAAVIGQHDMSAFVSLDADQVNRDHDALNAQMLAQAAPSLRSDYGIELVDLRIRRISLPEETTRTVFQSMVDDREKTATRYRTEGQSLAEAIKARAESAKNQILSFAQTKAETIKSAGVQASTRIIAQIPPEDQDFFIWLRQLDALEASLMEKSTVFFDSTHELFGLFAQPPAAPGAAPAPAGAKKP